MKELVDSLRKLLKIAVIVLLSAHFFAFTALCLANSTTAFAELNISLLPATALTVVCTVALCVALGAVEKWRKAAKENKKDVEILTLRQTKTLIAMLALTAVFLEVSVWLYYPPAHFGEVAFCMFVPTIEMLYAIPVWLSVIVLIKQFWVKRKNGQKL